MYIKKNISFNSNKRIRFSGLCKPPVCQNVSLAPSFAESIPGLVPSFSIKEEYPLFSFLLNVFNDKSKTTSFINDSKLMDSEELSKVENAWLWGLHAGRISPSSWVEGQQLINARKDVLKYKFKITLLDLRTDNGVDGLKFYWDEELEPFPEEVIKGLKGLSQDSGIPPYCIHVKANKDISDLQHIVPDFFSKVFYRDVFCTESKFGIHLRAHNSDKAFSYLHPPFRFFAEIAHRADPSFRLEVCRGEMPLPQFIELRLNNGHPCGAHFGEDPTHPDGVESGALGVLAHDIEYHLMRQMLVSKEFRYSLVTTYVNLIKYLKEKGQDEQEMQERFFPLVDLPLNIVSGQFSKNKVSGQFSKNKSSHISEEWKRACQDKYFFYFGMEVYKCFQLSLKGLENENPIKIQALSFLETQFQEIEKTVIDTRKLKIFKKVMKTLKEEQ